MDERVVQFRVGVVVLATVIIAAIMILLFGDAGSLVQEQKTVKITFEDAPGISEGTPVRRRGILIGRVEKVEVDENDQVVVTVRFNARYKVRQTDQPQISRTLMGESTLEFVPQKKGPAAGPLVTEGEVLKGVAPTDLAKVASSLQGDVSSALGSFNEAGHSIRDAGNEVNQLAARMNKLFEDNDGALKRVLAKMETSLDSFTQTNEDVQEVLGDEQLRLKLRKGLEELPLLLHDTRQMVGRLEMAAASANENMENLKGFTRPLGERGDQIIGKVETTVDQMNEMIEQLSAFGEALNSGEGSLGQLIHNPDLYQNLNQAAINIEEASSKLKPILYDVRVFTDKVARDPGRIGVSGVFRQRTGIK